MKGWRELVYVGETKLYIQKEDSNCIHLIYTMQGALQITPQSELTHKYGLQKLEANRTSPEREVSEGKKQQQWITWQCSATMWVRPINRQCHQYIEMLRVWQISCQVFYISMTQSWLAKSLMIKPSLLKIDSLSQSFFQAYHHVIAEETVLSNPCNYEQHYHWKYTE